MKYKGVNYVIDMKENLAKSNDGELIVLFPRAQSCLECVHGSLVFDEDNEAPASFKCLIGHVPSKSGMCDFYSEEGETSELDEGHDDDLYEDIEDGE